MKSEKNKIIRAFPGLIVGTCMISIIVWGISSNKNCKKLLSSKNAKITMVFAEKSVKKLLGGSIEVLTEYTIMNNNRAIRISNTGLNKLASSGLPIYVIYSLQKPSCYKFLWDSVVRYNGYEVRYVSVKYQGYDYEIRKIEK